MERMTTSARQIAMMSQAKVRRGLVLAAGWGLLCAVVAGCGSVVASTGAGGAASTPAGSASSASGAAGGGAAAGASASASAAASAPAGVQPGEPAVLVGCASVDQATAVSVTGLNRLVPAEGGTVMVTDRNPAQVRALFRDFCDAVTHPDVPAVVMRCPADFGTDYVGVFYDGNQVLARYTYAANGCRRVGVIVGSIIQSTMLAGRAAAAAPHLVADFAAVLTGGKPTVQPTTSNMNKGVTASPMLREVARLVEVELAVLDPEHERLPFGLGEVQLVAVGLGRVVHHVQLGLVGLVRGGRSIGGDIHLDPALLGIRRVVTQCVHAPRVPGPRSSRVPPR
jgi:hypothetical protein